MAKTPASGKSTSAPVFSEGRAVVLFEDENDIIQCHGCDIASVAGLCKAQSCRPCATIIMKSTRSAHAFFSSLQAVCGLRRSKERKVSIG